MELYFSNNLKKIDEESYSVFGYSENMLMENSGNGCFREILKTYSSKFLLDARFTVVCGKGNNGGDGFVLSRYLFNAGFIVKTVILGEINSYKGASEDNLNILIKLIEKTDKVETNEKNSKFKIIKITGENDIPVLEQILDETDILADAIFGVGLNRDISGFFKTVIDKINDKSAIRKFDILCIDVPSGLNADTGQYMGAGIKNNIKKIFTLGGLKVGFFIGEAEKLLLNEKTVLIDINQPLWLLKKYASKIKLINEKEIAGFFGRRKETGTKFDYGHLLVIAGSRGKSGAAYISSYAGLKGGAGLVTLATPSGLNNIMEEKTCEVMTYPVTDDNLGFFTENGAADIAKNLLKGKTAAVIGPGIGLKEETKKFLYKLLREIKTPIVLDADALNILSENKEFLKETAKKTDVIITPHFKEMERLSGIDRKDIEKDTLNIAKKFVKEFGVYLILKSSSMFIFDKNSERIYVQYGHSPLLASGGSGDVLSGLVGSLICGGMNLLDAMQSAAFALYYSAKNLEGKYGDFGAGAVKIAENIPKAVNKLIRNNEGEALL